MIILNTSQKYTASNDYKVVIYDKMNQYGKDKSRIAGINLKPGHRGFGREKGKA